MSDITGYKVSPSGGRVSLAKIHELKLLAKKRGDVILIDIDNISTQELSFQCEKGHIFTINGKKYRRSKGCPFCNGGSKTNAKEVFNKLVEDSNYKLVGKYKRAKEKVELFCPEGHSYSVTPNDFKTGYRCQTCYYTRSKPYDIDMITRVKSLADSNNHKIHDEVFYSYEKLKLTCDKGHTFCKNTHGYLNYPTCNICTGMVPEGSLLKLKSLCEARKFTFEEEDYVNATTKLVLTCPKGHKNLTSLNSFSGCRFGCTTCSKGGYDKNIKGYLYFLVNEEREIKVGITNFLEDRLNTLRNKTPFLFETLAVYEGCGYTVRELETLIKGKYESVRFFNKFDGSTEWKIFPTLEDINSMPLEKGLKLYNGGGT
ncbi:putative GIY-YIG endonuclease [Vibrio phage 424E50-1]|nr:putative GIY-YIG endonuclease [Vibrio phage 424E50-1]CAH9012767.1 putative GIY-YIG endonuclease [Vibrio phage 501E54-1]